MWLLPFTRVSIDSSRSVDEVLATLQRITRKPVLEFRLIRPEETATFTGEVSKEHLELCRAFRGRKSFVPFLIGRIVEGPTGARIEGVLQLHTVVLIFLGVWLALLAPFALIGLQQVIAQGANAERVAWIVPLVWLSAYPVCMLSFVSEVRKMQELLREVVGRPGAMETPLPAAR